MAMCFCLVHSFDGHPELYLGAVLQYERVFDDDPGENRSLKKRVSRCHIPPEAAPTTRRECVAVR